MEKKRFYVEARMKVVYLSGKSTLLAGSDAGGGGGGDNPVYSPAAGVTLSAMGAEGSLQ